jgi:CrcB protein
MIMVPSGPPRFNLSASAPILLIKAIFYEDTTQIFITTEKGERMEYLMIGIGGILGANARYLVGGWVTQRFGLAFPWGTFLINLSGSFVLGLFMAYMLRYPAYHYPRLFFAVGFLGAYTTFSTFSFESLQLIQNGRFLVALSYVVSSAALGLCGAWLGVLLGRAV